MLYLQDTYYTGLQQMWYQHDGHAAHYAYPVRQYLNQAHVDWSVGRVGPIL